MASSKGWALILGASSGFGGATCRELARNGFDIFGVHLDLRQTLPNAEAIVKDIEADGQRAVFFNVNAADAGKRADVVARVVEETAKDGSFIRVLLHSLAFGALQPVIAEDAKQALTQRQMEMTLDVMANSLIYWTQDLAAARPPAPRQPHLRDDQLRLHARDPELRRRLSRQGRPGVAHPPAGDRAGAARRHRQRDPRRRHRHARAAPHPGGRRHARARQGQPPQGRATTPEDIAQTIAVLSDERLQWLTGNVLGVDGGEDITMI